MSTFPAIVKSALQSIITNLLKFPREFAGNPSTDFTRNNGLLPVSKLIHIILGMRKDTIATELREYFGAVSNTIPTPSAFVQQRGKLLPKAFETIFHRFNEKFSPHCPINGYNLVAADGSDVRFYGMPDETEYICHQGGGERDCHAIHLNALLNIGSNRYIDADMQPVHEKNEYQSLCTMVDRYPAEKADSTIFIADRGFASLNVFTHIIRKGSLFLVRGKDITGKGFASKLSIPKEGEFDVAVPVTVIRRLAKKFRSLPNTVYLGAKATFDYIEYGCDDTFTLNLRIVRFLLPSGEYELLITNLSPEEFDTEKIKDLYFLRWGIETSFRGLKHNIGLNYFHGKKSQFIMQEIWTSLIMFNFCEVIASHIQPADCDRKHSYRLNRAEPAKICMHFFRLTPGSSLPDIETLALKHLLPVRPGRKFPRNKRPRRPASFSYR